MRIVEIAAGTPFETDPVSGGVAQQPQLPLPTPRARNPRVAPQPVPTQPVARRPQKIHDPDEHGLTVNEILHPDYPSVPNGSKNVGLVAQDLMKRGQTALKRMGVPGGMIDKPDPRTDEIISRAIASEVKAAITRDRSKSAIDWYTKSVREATTIASIVHPEIQNDPNMRMAFIAALAITSQGEKVIRNVALADAVFAYFKKHGQFPTNVKADAQKSMNQNFSVLNKLIAHMGLDGTREFLDTKFKVRDLERHGFNISGEKKDEDVYGSMIFGPKIGQGFYQNLNGNYDPVTMDLWFMRAWGRLTGTLVGKTDPKVLEKQQGRFVNALQSSGMPVPKNRAGLITLAKQIVKTHEKNFMKYRQEYDAGVRTKDEVVKAADRFLWGMNGINESPTSGSHRAWMRARVNRAREILAEQGINITNADLQAIWWYPEKQLYAKMGARDTDSISIDYAIAFRKLAQQKGIDDGTISAALSSLGG